MSKFVSALLMCGLLAGCGDSNPPVYPVSGSVTFNGETLPTGTVVFVPKSGGPTAQGEIGSDGKYSLTTFTNGDGALPGAYTVMVTAVKDNGPEAAHTPLIPDRFSSDKSGLAGEVKEQDMNIVDLDLKGKMPAARPAPVMP